MESYSLKGIVTLGVIDYFTSNRYASWANEEKESAINMANRFHVFEPLILEAHSDPNSSFTIEMIIPFVIFAMENEVDIMKKFKSIRDHVDEMTKVDYTDELASSFTSWSYNRSDLQSKVALMSLKDGSNQCGCGHDHAHE